MDGRSERFWGVVERRNVAKENKEHRGHSNSIKTVGTFKAAYLHIHTNSTGGMENNCKKEGTMKKVGGGFGEVGGQG